MKVFRPSSVQTQSPIGQSRDMSPLHVLLQAVTTVLYPLSVLKTNQQTAPSAQTTAQTVSIIWRTKGLPGFYRGYTTVVFGMIPSRLVRIVLIKTLYCITGSSLLYYNRYRYDTV